MNHTLAAGDAKSGPTNDILQIGFVCAELDFPFKGVFRRDDNGLYRLTKTEKLNPLEGAPAGIENFLNVDASLIDPTGFECPWCKARDESREDGTSHRYEFVHCKACDLLVCTGRSNGKNFVCSESCGSSGTIGGYIKEMHAAEGGVSGTFSPHNLRITQQ